jgi:hypothetical protein
LDIGKNIKQDLEMAKTHRQRRDSLKNWNNRVIRNQLNDIYNIKDYNKAERFFYEFYFTPNKSGFEALKNSGNIGKLKNKKIDSLLKAYYSQIDIIREKEISYNTFIENIEFKFKTEYSSFDYIVRIRSNYFDSISNLNLNSVNEQNKLLNFFKSKSFQAAVVRTGAEGTGPYTKLIDIGEGYLAELNTILND